MRLGPIVLKIRLGETRFGNMVAGAAELAIAQEETFSGDLAFVVPLEELAGPNIQDAGLTQLVTESFSVVVALRNDNQQRDKTGLGAYDILDEVRAELFRAILNWHPNTDTEHPISYVGGSIIDVTPSYLWYQFDFQYDRFITEEDGAQDSNIDDFLSIYAEYVLVCDQE